MLELRTGVAHGVTLYLEVPERICQVPIGTLNVRHDVYRSLTELDVREREIAPGDLNGPAVEVKAASTQERLSYARRKV